MGWYRHFRPYVPVANRLAAARREARACHQKGELPSPVIIEGRDFATTFWGRAWCDHISGFGDCTNRLHRGATYVRNGSVVDLKISGGRVAAIVAGSEPYRIEIGVKPLAKKPWKELISRCSGRIGSLVDLLQGKLSTAVMESVTDRDAGLFPKRSDISMNCSCPDGASVCKHLAAVIYGIGNRLDRSPELLFVLRGVDHAELLERTIAPSPSSATDRPTIAASELETIFDIEIEPATAKPAVARTNSKPMPKKRVAVADGTKRKPKAIPAAKKTNGKLLQKKG